MMVSLAGGIKLVERTRALHLSRLPKLRQSMMTPMYIPRVSAAYDPLSIELNALRYEYSNEEDTKLAESKVVKHAHFFFQIFMVFIVDLIYKRDQRTVSRRYFSRVSAMDALRVISTEFHFFYEVLHTKVLAIHSKWSYFFRSIAFTLVAVAFVLLIRSKKHGLSGLDVKITYILLSGGIALDVIAFMMILFSDWTIAKIMLHETRLERKSSLLCKLLSAMIDMKKPQFAKCKANANTDLTYNVLNTWFIFRRWSETISACNLFSEYFGNSPRKMYKCDEGSCLCNILIFPFRMIGKVVSCFHQAGKTIVESCHTDLQWTIANTEHVSKNPFIYNLWIFIFEEVKRKSVFADDDPEKVREICETRGNWFLKSLPSEIGIGKFLEHLTGTSYDTSIIVWHIATEICYNIEETVVDQVLVEKREFSKILSDYMMYLLFNQPKLMSTVANVAQITSFETVDWLRVDPLTNGIRNVEQLCKRMIEDDQPSSLRSPIAMGTRLAQDMATLGEMKWKVTSGVWAEMLSYAAIHIKGETHMQVLSEGGELLAFVWLLMLHFGSFYKAEWGISYEPVSAWFQL